MFPDKTENRILDILTKISLQMPCFHFFKCYNHLRASEIAQLVENLPAMQVTTVLFLSREDPLENTHSVFLGFPCESASSLEK